MSQRTIWRILTVTIIVILSAALLSGQTAVQSRSSESGALGRYQLEDGPVTKVFDTYTGKLYLWLPRDEKAGKEPYIFVQDPINATGTQVEIKWITKPAGK